LKTIYPSVSLTHVKTDEEKNMVRTLIKWLGSTFNASVSRWAFDLEKWKPIACSDINEFDNSAMDASELMIVFYFTNDGSDGRGGEIIRRLERGGAFLAFKKKGLKVSRYIVDGLRKKGIEIVEFEEFTEIEPIINWRLNKIDSDALDCVQNP